ncbi:MAG: hypothetical protein KDB23_22235, partial [Planctomycetales bacterium]|nr:hypothetical protein [Planctomycetales bacterium]
FAFVVPQLDEFGALQYDNTGKIITRLPTSADDIELQLSDSGLLTFNLKFGGKLLDEEIPLDFGGSLPGISLDIDAKLATVMDYLMGIGLGLGNVGTLQSPDFQVFLDTSGINTAGEEVALDVSATLTEDSAMTGTLGFIRVTFEEANENGGSGVHGHLGFDIADANGDGRLTPGEGVELAVNALAYAEADIFAQLDTTFSDYLPSVTTTLHYDQSITAGVSTNGGANFAISDPQLILEDVTLNVGSVFNSFLGDTLQTIKDIIEPIRPVVDLLTTEVDMGVTKFQLIDLAYLRLPPKVVDTAKIVLGVLKDTITFLDTVGVLATADGINFGTFNLTADNLKSKDSPTPANTTSSKPADRSNLTPAQEAALGGPDQKGMTRTKTPSNRDPKKRSLPSTKRFSIPVLEDPASIIDFILDRAPVDLFYYDLPDLDLFFEYRQTKMVYPGLNVGFFGNISATTNFDFGYDTSGLRSWMNEDFDIAKSYLLLDGFYLDDHGQENSGQDDPEVTLKAAVGAIAMLGVGGLVEAGVQGGLEATITFDLNDKLTEYVGNDVFGDGKLYGRELLSRILVGPQCLFDMHGELRAFLEAYLWIGVDLGFSEITIFEARERFVDYLIAEFNYECSLGGPSDIATLTSGVLNLAYTGDDSSHDYTVLGTDVPDEGVTLQWLSQEGYFDADYYSTQERADFVTYLEANFGAANAGEKIIVVSTGSRAEVFKAADVNSITATGTSGGDTYRLNALNGLLSAITLNTGAGEDVVLITGNGVLTDLFTNIAVNLGDGDDYVRVDPRVLGSTGASYTLRGGAGGDRIKIMKDDKDEAGKVGAATYTYSNVTIYGDDGDDVLFGHNGSETIYGGAGTDVINSYGGADTIDSGDGNDYVSAGSGNDTVSGGAGVDQLYGGPGDDTINGGAGDDRIYGEAGNDTINADAGDDSIVGGAGTDTINAGAGDDLITWQYGDDGDTVEGDAGDDVISIVAYVIDQSKFNDDPDNYLVDDGKSDTIYMSATTVNDSSGTTKRATMTMVHGTDPLKTFTLGSVENLKLDPGKGTDDIRFGDLQTTAFDSIRVSGGETRGLVSEYRVTRDQLGMAVGQDFTLTANVGDTFRLKFGNFGKSSDVITVPGIEDDLANVDPYLTAIAIEEKLRELLDSENVGVTYQLPSGVDRAGPYTTPYKFKVTGIEEVNDGLQMEGFNVSGVAGTYQQMTLGGATVD